MTTPGQIGQESDENTRGRKVFRERHFAKINILAKIFDLNQSVNAYISDRSQNCCCRSHILHRSTNTIPTNRALTEHSMDRYQRKQCERLNRASKAPGLQLLLRWSRTSLGTGFYTSFSSDLTNLKRVWNTDKVWMPVKVWCWEQPVIKYALTTTFIGVPPSMWCALNCDQ